MADTSTPHLVLARKWRPERFSELVGQEHVTRTLGEALKRGRIAHAFLFTGIRGVGKTTAARILARCLNCERGPTPEPCGECAACIEIRAGRSLDVSEIDGATYRKIDDARAIIENLSYRPAPVRYHPGAAQGAGAPRGNRGRGGRAAPFGARGRRQHARRGADAGGGAGPERQRERERAGRGEPQKCVRAGGGDSEARAGGGAPEGPRAESARRQPRIVRTRPARNA